MFAYIRPTLVDHGHVITSTKGVTSGDTKDSLTSYRPVTANTSPAPNGETASSIETATE